MVEGAAGDSAKSEITIGFVFTQRDDFSELAAHPGSSVCCWLRDFARAEPLEADEPLLKILAGG